VSVGLSELARATFHGGSLCVWAHGEVRPCLTIPANARNVQALARVLQERAREDPARPVPHPLGRLLFQRPCLPPLGPWFVAIVALPVFGMALRALDLLYIPVYALLLGPFALAAALLGCLRACRPWLGLLHAHERGVGLIRRGKERLLPFDALGELT